MAELLLKFDMLDAYDKQQVLNFLNFLVAQKQQGLTPQKPGLFDYQAYRKRILSIGPWSSDDVAVIEDTRNAINQWKIQ